MTTPEILSERDDEILLFDALPASITDGTSYDYFTKYDGFDEEIYYMLECATKRNADPEKLIEMCREVQQERNRMLIERFENKLDPFEVEIEMNDEKINYF